MGKEEYLEKMKKIREKNLIFLLKYFAHFVKYKIITTMEFFLNSKKKTISYPKENLKFIIDKEEVAPYRKNIIMKRHERKEVELIKKYLPPKKDIIELGGGIGFISCLVNKRIKKNQKHIVVEANKEIVPILKKNREINNCNFKIEEKAYSPTLNNVNFYKKEEHLSSSTINPKEKIGSEKVQTINLNKICSKYNISDFILIADIEGEEIELINNELDLLEDKCEIIIIELHFKYPKAKKAKEKLDNSLFNMKEKKKGKNNTVFVYSK